MLPWTLLSRMLSATNQIFYFSSFTSAELEIFKILRRMLRISREKRTKPGKNVIQSPTCITMHPKLLNNSVRIYRNMDFYSNHDVDISFSFPVYPVRSNFMCIEWHAQHICTICNIRHLASVVTSRAMDANARIVLGLYNKNSYSSSINEKKTRKKV